MLRTESVWLLAIAHGSMNSISQYAFEDMNDPAPTDVARDMQVLGAGFLALFVVGVILLSRLTDRSMVSA